MPLVTLDKATGMQLRKALLAQDGRVLLQANIVLTERDVKAIHRRFGDMLLDVRDDVLPELEPAEVELDTEVRVQAASAVSHTIKALSQRATAPSAKPLFEAAAALLESTLSLDGALAALETMRGQGNALVQHSVQTSVYGVVLGYAARMPRRDLLNIALGGLLHDLGKGFLDPAVLHKPGRLTPEEYDLVCQHPRLGLEALKRSYKFAPEVERIVYQHHERLDGSGYPEHLEADAIQPVVRAVQIADVFDALVSPRVYKPGWSAHHAAKYLRRHPNLFDADLVRLFLQRIAIYPTGSLVYTADRYLAVVVGQNPARPQAPIVLVVANRWHKSVAPHVLDLAQSEEEAPIASIARRWPEGLLDHLDRAELRRLVQEGVRPTRVA